MRTWEDVIKEKMESFEGVLPDNFFVELRARRSGVVPNARSRRGSAAWYIVPATAIAIAALLLTIRPFGTKPAISNREMQAGSAVVIRDTSKAIESTARAVLTPSITAPSKQIRYSPTPLTSQETLSNSAGSTEIIAEKDSSSVENAIIQVEEDTASDSIERPLESPFIPEYLKKRKTVKLNVGAVSGIIAGSGLCLAVATPFLGMIGSGSSAGEARPHFTGVEINPVCVDMARRSALMNGQQERIRFLEEDIRNVCTAGAKTVSGPACAPASFDAVTANPPYMTGGAGLTGENRDLTIARHEVLCNIGDVAGAASRALRFGGHLYLVHRPHRLMDICRACGANGLEVKRIRMVHPFAGKEANMVLIDAVKGGRSYVHVEAPLIVYREKGVYTQEVREIYG